MDTTYLVIAILFPAMLVFSGLGKIRRDARQVRVVHEIVGVPLTYFPLLATCEFGGALGLVLGIRWPPLGVAAGIGLVLYLCRRDCVASACRRCQRHWTRRLHVGGRGGSVGLAHPDLQTGYLRLNHQSPAPRPSHSKESGADNRHGSPPLSPFVSTNVSSLHLKPRPGAGLGLQTSAAGTASRASTSARRRRLESANCRKPSFLT